MATTLDAIKIRADGIPMDIICIGGLFGERYDEFGHGHILKYLDEHYKTACARKDKDGDWDYRCWVITKARAKKIYRFLNKTICGTDDPYTEYDYEGIFESHKWEQQFDGGKVYVYNG
jgi:hypothetical protein